MRMPHEIRITRVDNKGEITCDGEPFPFYIADGPRIEVDGTATSTVFVGILCDRVVVDNGYVPSELADAEIAAS